MMSKGQGAAHIMKFVVFALIIGFVVLLMLFASGSNKPFEEVSKSVEDSLDTEALTAQDAAMFKRNFGLNAADYAGVLYYSSGASMSAEEVLLVKVNRDSQIQEVVDAIDDAALDCISDFEGYAPDEVKTARGCQTERKRNLYFLCMFPRTRINI